MRRLRRILRRARFGSTEELIEKLSKLPDKLSKLPAKIGEFSHVLVEGHNLPAKSWGTKGFEFWTFLSLLLIRSNCSRILELGSGRSTIVFAEYAKFRNARLTSIETNRKWYNKARLELRWLHLAIDPIHLLKLDPAVEWYDVAQFRSLARGRGAFDFVLVDGPNELDGDSLMRSSETALREVRDCCSNADVVVVDDVHRRHILGNVDRMLSDPGEYEKWFYDYVPCEAPYSNSLCLCVKKDSQASREIPPLREMLGLRLYATLRLEDCSQN